MSCNKFYIGLKLLVTLLLASLALTMAQLSSADEKPYDVETRSLGDIAKKVERSASGLVVSEHDATIKAEISAVIDQIAVKVGNRVNTGDLLVELECTDYRLAAELANADLQASEANLSFAQLQYQRALDLKKKSLNSVLDVDTRKTELASNRAAKLRSEVLRKQAARNVERCQVLAPYSGVVVEKLVSKGELVNFGTPVLHLVDTGNIEVSANVNPLQASNLNEQFDYQFVTQHAEDKQSYPIQLVRIVDVIDSSRRSVEVRFNFIERRPPVGASGKVFWSGDGFALPARYLTRRDGVDGIYILRQDSVEFVALPNLRSGITVQVDLPADTKVIVSDVHHLDVS